MFVWRVDFIERHIMGSEKWDANAESGYAAEVDGVMFEVVDRAEDEYKGEIGVLDTLIDLRQLQEF